MSKKISPTNENIHKYATEPLMRWLIEKALQGGDITYGQAKERLEKAERFSTIHSKTMGKPAGYLMDRILDVDPKAPLINVLLVDQKKRQPSTGAGGYLADRFNQPRLRSSKVVGKPLWIKYIDLAAGEAYAYSKDQWSDLYRRVFGRKLDLRKIERSAEESGKGREKDGLPRGRHGEGPHHKALRLWVKDNPSLLKSSYANCRSETEVDLPSGDRIDVVFYLKDRTVAVEVKSRDSNANDMIRGVYQCIKYRAVLQAADARIEPQIEAILVTERALPGEVKDLVRMHQIKHFLAPMDRA